MSLDKDIKSLAKFLSPADLLSALPKAILVWKFHEAPEEYKKLSEHGGDEDWLALLPKELAESHIPWLENGLFGACDVSQHILPDGRLVFIGAHA